MFARWFLFTSLLLVSTLTAAEPGLLSAKENLSYKTGLDNLKADAREGRVIQLNLGDQQQYNTLLNHLKLRGKTPANAPQLFRLLKAERHRVFHGGDVVTYQTMHHKQEEGGPKPMHLVEAALANDNQTVYNASSSLPDGTTYTYLDVVMVSSDPMETDVPAVIEEFGGGTDVVASGTIETAAFSANKSDIERSIDSWSITARDVNGNGTLEEDEFVSATFVSRPLLKNSGLSGLNLDDPVDRTADGQISICLNRTWTRDCDVNLTGSPRALKVPFKGSYRTPPGFTIDDKGLTHKTRLGDPQDYIWLQLTQTGGACQPHYEFDMTDFWSAVKISDDKRTLSWDFTGADAIDFGKGCRQVQDRVEFHVNLRLPVTKYGFPSYLPIFMTTRVLEDGSFGIVQIDAMKITNSCLAAGTLIQLTDGSQVAVEDITAGDLVFNEYRRKQAAPVVDTAFGFEDKPMVRIESESGRVLMMTDLHPVITARNGVTLARDLEIGDVVPTIDGAEKLMSVTRVAYDGNVYNLKLASKPGKAPAADNTVYANGFMVGDGTMQAHYEKLDRERKGSVLNRIPSAWHDHYRDVNR